MLTDTFIVTVDFPKGVPADLQGKAMLRMEQYLREQGCKANVLKATMPDDSKLRRSMTPLQRASL